MTYLRDIALSLWFGVAVFAFGIPSYLLLTPEVLPAWVTLGGTAAVAVWVTIYSLVDEIGARRAVRKRFSA